jgi:hypothetical protein
LQSNGTAREIGNTQLLKAKTKFFWDKIIDGAKVTVESPAIQYDRSILTATQEVIRGIPGTSFSIKPKNELTTKVFIISTEDIANTTALSNIVYNDNYNTNAVNSGIHPSLDFSTYADFPAIGVVGTMYRENVYDDDYFWNGNQYVYIVNMAYQLQEDQAALDTAMNNIAIKYAQNIFSFYGNRSSAIDMMLHLDDNTLAWEMLDNLNYNGLNYFFPTMEFDLAARTLTISPAETTGHQFDIRSIVVVPTIDIP